MIKIKVVTAGATSPNGTAFLLPLLKFKKELKDADFDLKVQSSMNEATECDFLIIESKYYRKRWTNEKKHVLDEIEKLSQSTKIIWCDQSDSTGTISPEVLPFVTKYAKAQLLKNKNEYLRTHYGARIYTDFYNKHYNVIDSDNYSEPAVKNKKDLRKFTISWNSSFLNFGALQPQWLLLAEHFPYSNLVPLSRPSLFSFSEKPLDISVRMGTNHRRETIAFQRKKIASMFTELAKSEKVSRRLYLKEISQSKICVSPFGYGEITLKDFEVFLAGSLLLKPSMNHLETWPDLFIENETYISHRWDFNDILEKVEKFLSDKEMRMAIAHQGQKKFSEYTTGRKAAEHFIKQFSKIIN